MIDITCYDYYNGTFHIVSDHGTDAWYDVMDCKAKHDFGPGEFQILKVEGDKETIREYLIACLTFSKDAIGIAVYDLIMSELDGIIERSAME